MAGPAYQQPNQALGIAALTTAIIRTLQAQKEWHMATRNFFKRLLPACILSGAVMQANAIVLVQSHKPLATIVIDENASAQTQAAAATLQSHLQTSTGAKLPIANTPGKTANIHIGATPYTRQQHLDLNTIDQDGFILQFTDNKNIIIIGGSDWGTEFGVYDFLERHVGVRWLMPTAIGTDIPLHETLNIKAANVRQNPVYLSRFISPINILKNGPQEKWGRFNRARGRISFHHNLMNIFPVSKYGKEHPEFYPLINGNRYIPANNADHRWQPNLSAPGIIEAAAKNIEDAFQRNPNATSYSLGINDSNNWDQSDASKARRSGLKNHLGMEDVSDDYFTWANAVVEKVLLKHPGKWFGTLAYNSNSTPPTKISIHPNIVPFITYDRMRWGDPALRDAGHRLNEQWEKASPTLGYYDYVYGISYLLPRVYFHGMQEYLSWGAAHHVRHYYGELYPNWGEGPKPWLLTKLLWNPDQSVDVLLDDWYSHFAGAAAAPKLRAFYAIWEKFWTTDIFKSRWNSSRGQYLPFNTSPIYLLDVKATDVAQADKLMRQALQRADTPQRKARVAKLQQMWSLYKTSIIAYQEKYAASHKDFQTTARAMAIAGNMKNPAQAATERRALLESFKSDPLFSLSAQYITQYPLTAGANWGLPPEAKKP